MHKIDAQYITKYSYHRSYKITDSKILNMKMIFLSSKYNFEMETNILELKLSYIKIINDIFLTNLLNLSELVLCNTDELVSISNKLNLNNLAYLNLSYTKISNKDINAMMNLKYIHLKHTPNITFNVMNK